MFGFLAGIATAISAMQTKFLKGKRRIQKRKQKRKEVVAEEKGRVTELESDKSKDTKLKAKIFLARLRTLLLQLISILISFIELLLVFLGAFWILVILAVVIVILIVMLMIFSIAETPLPEVPPVDVPPTESQQPIGVLDSATWTDQELEIRGAALTADERNLYKIIMWGNASITGYGEQLAYLKSTDTVNIDGTSYPVSLHDMFLSTTTGIQSTETGYASIFDAREAPDGDIQQLVAKKSRYTSAVFEITGKNIVGYHQYGKTAWLDNTGQGEAARSGAVPYLDKMGWLDASLGGTDEAIVRYMPIMMSYSTEFLWTKRPSSYAGIVKIAKEVASECELGYTDEQIAHMAGEMLVIRITLGYHGVTLSDYNMYLAAFAYVYSGGSFETRSLINYTFDLVDTASNTLQALNFFTTGLSEGLVGHTEPAHNGEDVPGGFSISDASFFETDEVAGVKVLVNGVPLPRSLIGTMYDEYGNLPSFQNLINNAISGTENRDGEDSRNLIYPFGCFLMGNTIVRHIERKITGFGGAFINQRGVGQLHFKRPDGSIVTVNDLIETSNNISEFFKNNASVATKEEFISLLGYDPHLDEQYGLTVDDMVNYHNFAYITERDEITPFFLQSTKETSEIACPACASREIEILRNTRWCSNGTSSSLFGKDGCTLYAPSHAISLITGKVVNPMEMILSGIYFARNSGGANSSTVFPTIQDVRCVAYHDSGNNLTPANNADVVNDCLDSGGVVQIKAFRTYMGATSDLGHALCIVGGSVDTNTGERIYYVYNSTKNDHAKGHTLSWFTGKALLSWMYYPLS